MCLALAVGRGDSTLARLDGHAALAHYEDVVIVGRRDDDEPYYGQEAMRASAILDVTDGIARAHGPARTAEATLERLANPALGGFWIHLDADAIDPADIPAVDSPTPGGFNVDAMAQLISALAHHPAALGMELTIYDPGLDPERTSAARLATLLERALA
jgi:arginase